ncbi:MAG: helix-turn-helix domain-containing protein [Chlorobiaceae bacterium]|nr:helix-turn-helix domain-containing protein [Chlorobiaceae bacterium]
MAGSATDMSSLELLANKLKAGRLAKQLSVEEVSRLIRIQKPYLEKLEACDFSFLPNVYVYYYLRAYTEAMGLGGEDILEQCRTVLRIPCA